MSQAPSSIEDIVRESVENSTDLAPALGSQGTTKSVRFTDSHENPFAYAVAAWLAEEEDLEVISHGDIIEHGASEISFKEELRATGIKWRLEANNGLQEKIKKGTYTKEQIERAAAGLRYKGVRENISRKILSHVNKTFGGKLKGLGGNHDPEGVMKEVFGDNLLNGMYDENGRKVLAVSGGGAFNLEGCLADYPNKAIDRARPGKKHLLRQKKIHEVMVHSPDHSPHGEKSAETIREGLIERELIGAERPGLLSFGHLHGGTKVWYDTTEDRLNGIKKKQLKFTPGVSTLSAFGGNKGSHASIAVAEFDNATGDLVQVEEYRMYHDPNTDTVDVELYREHVVDHEREEVKVNHIGRMVAKDFAAPRKDFYADDPHHKQEINVEYEGLSADELDTRLRHNLFLSEERIKNQRTEVKAATDLVRNKYLNKHILEKKISDKDQEEIQGKVHREVARAAARRLRLDFAKLESQSADRKVLCEALSQMAYGIGEEDILDVLHLPGNDTENVPFNWSEKLSKKVYENKKDVVGLQSYFLEGVTQEQWQALADLHTPTSVERKRELHKEEAQELWIQASQKGLLEEEDFLQTNAFKRKEASGYKFSNEELGDLFGLEDVFKQSLTGKYDNEEIKTVRSAISAGRKVLADKRGEYLLGPAGKTYLSPEMREGLSYETGSLTDVLDREGTIVREERPGVYRLFPNGIGELIQHQQIGRGGVPVEARHEDIDFAPYLETSNRTIDEHNASVQEQERLSQQQANQTQTPSGLPPNAALPTPEQQAALRDAYQAANQPYQERHVA